MSSELQQERVITGFHAIEERVRAVLDSKKTDSSNADTSVFDLLYAKPGPRVKKIIKQATEAGITVTEVAETTLNEKTRSLPPEIRDHRGIVLVMHGAPSATTDVDLETFIKTLGDKRSVVVMLDGVTDPHNVGAIIRSCDQFGADLLIVPSRGKAGSGEVVQRTSAGASAWVPVAVVPNLTRAAELLKDAGFWIYGADANGDSLPNARLPEKVALIMGSEGTGISRLLKTSCDGILSIPTCGRLDSLNVSVAAGVLLYELTTRRTV